MKKIILLIMVVAAAAIPGVPYLIGTTVEEGFHLEHQEMAREAALAGFDVELVDYQRKLFSATATTRINLFAPQAKEQLSFELQHRISHIPQLTSRVIATVNTQAVMRDEVEKALAPLFKDEVPLTVNTRIFLDGHQEALISGPAASGEIAGRESVAIEWQGLQGKAWQGAGRDELSLTVNAPGLVIKPVHVAPQAYGDPVGVTQSGKPDTNAEHSAQQLKLMRIGQLHYQAEMHKGESGMWHGKTQGNIAAFALEAMDAAGEVFTMDVDNIDMHTEQGESDGLVRASAVMTSNRLSVNGFDLTKASYDVAVENLDAQVLRAWQTTLSQMMRGTTQAAEPFAPLVEQLPALVNAEPVIKINDMSVESPMGRFALKVDSRITGKWDDMLLHNPALLATMITADIDASVPRGIVVSAMQDNVRRAVLAQNAANDGKMNPEEIDELVQQSVGQQLSGLLGQGYLKENGTQLETRVEYNAGRLQINGLDGAPLMGTMMQ